VPHLRPPRGGTFRGVRRLGISGLVLRTLTPTFCFSGRIPFVCRGALPFRISDVACKILPIASY
jgi:hypothetical protein